MSAPPAAPTPPARAASRSADSRPGWYPDPDGDTNVWRWWTGSDWTAWLADRPDAPPPPYGRSEWGPVASAGVTPRSRKFGVVPRVVLGVVIALVLVAVMALVGWPHREESPLMSAEPSTTYQPTDLSVVCDQTRLTVGGRLGVDVESTLSVTGPSFNLPLNNLQCRGSLPDEDGGNSLISLALASSEQSTGTVREQAEKAFTTLEQELYVGGAATASKVTGAAADDLGDAWRITAVLVGPKGGNADDFELVVVDLGEGRRGVWVWVTGVKVSDAGRAEMEAVRKSLRLS